MAREAFIRDVWRADRQAGPQQVQTESGDLDGNALAKALRSADQWLTPKAVEAFNSADFAGVSPERGAALQKAVERFREVAAAVPPNAAPKRQQAQLGRQRLEELVSALRTIIEPEWVAALENLVRLVETWARNRKWEVKRDTKQLSEALLRVYSVPRLLLHSPEGRLLLDPVTRFAAGAEGLVELCVMPSYDSAKIVYSEGDWHLQPLRATGRRQVLSEGSFVKIVRQLLESNA